MNTSMKPIAKSHNRLIALLFLTICFIFGAELKRAAEKVNIAGVGYYGTLVLNDGRKITANLNFSTDEDEYFIKFNQHTGNLGQYITARIKYNALMHVPLANAHIEVFNIVKGVPTQIYGNDNKLVSAILRIEDGKKYLIVNKNDFFLDNGSDVKEMIFILSKRSQ